MNTCITVVRTAAITGFDTATDLMNSFLLPIFSNKDNNVFYEKHINKYELVLLANHVIDNVIVNRA